ncbi:hypothetical protein NDU88_006863, partial [Pleurodeles waltl]
LKGKKNGTAPAGPAGAGETPTTSADAHGSAKPNKHTNHQWTRRSRLKFDCCRSRWSKGDTAVGSGS